VQENIIFYFNSWLSFQRLYRLTRGFYHAAFLELCMFCETSLRFVPDTQTHKQTPAHCAMR